MLTEICQNLKNWFVLSDDDKLYGTFTIDDGTISPSVDLKPGQYFRIVGSALNDGVHCLDEQDVLSTQENALHDETFTGAIWKLSFPIAFLLLAKEIKQWQTDNASVTTSPFTSESFGGYSYTKQSDSNGSTVTWQSVFRKRLNTWRKL